MADSGKKSAMRSTAREFPKPVNGVVRNTGISHRPAGAVAPASLSVSSEVIRRGEPRSPTSVVRTASVNSKNATCQSIIASVRMHLYVFNVAGEGREPPVSCERLKANRTQSCGYPATGMAHFIGPCLCVSDG
jgi:hypothetical protein